MRHFCLVAVWVANLQQLCALQQQSTRAPALQQQSTRVPAVDQSRRQFFAQAAASTLVATAPPRAASAANETAELAKLEASTSSWLHKQCKGLKKELKKKLKPYVRNSTRQAKARIKVRQL